MVPKANIIVINTKFTNILMSLTSVDLNFNYLGFSQDLRVALLQFATSICTNKYESPITK